MYFDHWVLSHKITFFYYFSFKVYLNILFITILVKNSRLCMCRWRQVITSLLSSEYASAFRVCKFDVWINGFENQLVDKWDTCATFRYLYSGIKVPKCCTGVSLITFEVDVSSCYILLYYVEILNKNYTYILVTM